MMKFLFSGQGRVSRKAAWLFVLATIGVSFVAGIIDVLFLGTPLESADTGPMSLLVSIALIWPSIAVSAKRFHDRGMSGWWVLYFILIIGAGALLGLGVMAMQGDGSPVLGGFLVAIGVGVPFIWQFIILYILPGKKGPNKYGPNPLDPVGGDIAQTFD